MGASKKKRSKIWWPSKAQPFLRKKSKWLAVNSSFSRTCTCSLRPPTFAMAVPSMPVKRWNFRKAKWSHYITLTNKFAKNLLLPDLLDVDAAYQDFCNTIKKAAKKTIPRGYRNNYIPCWDAECESLYKTFMQSPQGVNSSLAPTALLAKLDRKRRDRWSETVWSTAFSHSSRIE